MFYKRFKAQTVLPDAAAPAMSSKLLLATLLGVIALSLGSCAYPGGYGYSYYPAYPYYGPGYPYYGGGFVIGGVHHREHFGGHHFVGRSFVHSGGHRGHH